MLFFWMGILASIWKSIHGHYYSEKFSYIILFFFILLEWNMVWTLFLILFRFFESPLFRSILISNWIYDTNEKFPCVCVFVCRCIKVSTKSNNNFFLFKWENPLNIQYSSWPLWMRWHQKTSESLSFVVNDIIIDINMYKFS